MVEKSQWVLQVGWLLVEGSHAELLVHECLVFAAGGSVPIVRVVAEGTVVQVAQVWHDGVDSTDEAFVLYLQVGY